MTAQPTKRLEFWPDYGQGPLWCDGQSVVLSTLPLPESLREQLARWNSAYSDDKLPSHEGGDPVWLEQGRLLLQDIRNHLAADFDVVVHEDWWGEPGLPFRQPK